MFARVTIASGGLLTGGLTGRGRATRLAVRDIRSGAAGAMTDTTGGGVLSAREGLI